MTVVVPPNAADVGRTLEGIGVHEAGGGELFDVRSGCQCRRAAQGDRGRRSRPSGIKAFAEGCDFAVGDADISWKIVARRCNAAITDHEIEWAWCSEPLPDTVVTVKMSGQEGYREQRGQRESGL